MQALHQYLQEHAQPADEQAQGPDVADLVFFKVQRTGGDPETLAALVRQTKGEFAEVDVFDGKEHSYIELGAWLGSQEAALLLMGLGSTMGLWQLLSPYSMLGDSITADVARNMAGYGLLTIVTNSEPVKH
jgi:hypothetical protein